MGAGDVLGCQTAEHVSHFKGGGGGGGFGATSDLQQVLPGGAAAFGREPKLFEHVRVQRFLVGE